MRMHSFNSALVAVDMLREPIVVAHRRINLRMNMLYTYFSNSAPYSMFVCVYVCVFVTRSSMRIQTPKTSGVFYVLLSVLVLGRVRVHGHR